MAGCLLAASKSLSAPSRSPTVPLWIFARPRHSSLRKSFSSYYSATATRCMSMSADRHGTAETSPSSPSLPEFKYNLSPLESIRESSTSCASCGISREYVHDPNDLDGIDEIDDDFVPICPWCIADGSAHAKFPDMEFVDAGFIGPSADHIPKISLDELTYRTPTFVAWQETQWWTCCGDVATYVGRAGDREITMFGDQCVNFFRDHYRDEFGDDGSEEGWKEFRACLGRDGDTTAYVFRCTKCQSYGGFIDSN